MPPSLSEPVLGGASDRALFFSDETRRAFADADAIADQAVRVEGAASTPAKGLRDLVALFGQHGLLDYAVPSAQGGAFETVRASALCLVRERLGKASPLCDLAFAMQGLGGHPLSLCTKHPLATEWLGQIRTGQAVAAFALTEPNAGTDVSAMSTTAILKDDHYEISGAKCWISNAGIADVYALFAVTAPNETRRRVSAFILPANTKGLSVVSQNVLGGHPIGQLHLDKVLLPVEYRLGDEGDGMRLALGTLHRFRTTVGAAAVGFATRALEESAAHVQSRHQFGKPLSALDAVQQRLALMATDIDAARLLVYRAARLLDAGQDRRTVAYAGSMAKRTATEAAQHVIDHAVQLHGGRGVDTDHIIARLYEEVRALRIYEGTNDVQLTLMARHILSKVHTH